MAEQFINHIKEMLKIGSNALSSNPNAIGEIGTTNAKGDKTIEMDKRIEDLFITYIKDHNLPVNIFSEEIGTVKFHPNPLYTVSFDPLDGSTNYKLGKGLYPYGILIACYKGIEPTLDDVVAAGAIEHTRGLGWLYSKGRTTDLEGNQVVLRNDWQPGKSTPIYLDLYYKRGYEDYAPLAEQLFIRNTGSTIGNLSYLLSNASTGLGGVGMGAEEIGAVVALIKGAGGIVVNHQGQSLGSDKFDTNRRYGVLGGCRNIIDFAVLKLSSF